MLSRLLLNPRAAFLLVAAASAWMCATLPVFSQEAYYWTYAQHPDLSYFDHPPMVAWPIWLGTHLFGDGGIGVRFGTWACGLGVTALGARLLRDFGVGERGQSLWILLNLATPILTMTHFLANPDPALVLGWTAVMFAMWRARGGSLGWWLVAGAAAGTAMLAKYSGAFLLPSGLVLLLTDPALRRQLTRPGPYLAVLVAALVFMPVVAWNVQNDFESFRFQTGERFAKGTFGLRWLLGFLGEQAFVVHPVLVLAIAGSVGWFRAPRARRCQGALVVGLRPAVAGLVPRQLAVDPGEGQLAGAGLRAARARRRRVVGRTRPGRRSPEAGAPRGVHLVDVDLYVCRGYKGPVVAD